MPRPRRFFGELEALRGVAACLVVLFHLPPWFAPFYQVELFRHGYLAVHFFFVLSGFVLFHGYWGRLDSTAALRAFAALRVGRLYPVHILFLLPFVAIEFARNLASGHPPLARIAHALVVNLFLAQGLGLIWKGPFLNFPSWSISTEFYTYLLFALGAYTLSRRAFLTLSAVVSTACLVALLGYGARVDATSGVLQCVCDFFAGCLVCAIYEARAHYRLRGDGPLVIAMVIVAGLLCHWDPWWIDECSLPAAALLILCVVWSPGSALNAWLSTRPLRWLGRISYSVYMSHALVQWLARNGCRLMWNGPELTIQGEHISQLNLGGALIVYPAVIVTTLAVGHASYTWVEAPLRDWVRRRVAARVASMA